MRFFVSCKFVMEASSLLLALAASSNFVSISWIPSLASLIHRIYSSIVFFCDSIETSSSLARLSSVRSLGDNECSGNASNAWIFENFLATISRGFETRDFYLPNFENFKVIGDSPFYEMRYWFWRINFGPSFFFRTVQSNNRATTSRSRIELLTWGKGHKR